MTLNKGVNRNVATTAIARELACFIWRMMTKHVSQLNVNKGNQAEETDFVRFHLQKQRINIGYRGGGLEHFQVRIICEIPLLTLYLYILIHARRRQDSRRTIDLQVTNPRISEWPKPGTATSEALSWVLQEKIISVSVRQLQSPGFSCELEVYQPFL